MKTNILVLAAGHVGFETHDGGYPLCLSEFEGVSLIERIVANASEIKNAQFTFALREEDIERFHLDRVVTLLASNAKIVRVPNSTRGSACTALLAACLFKPNEDVLIVSANELVDMNLAEVVEEFRLRSLAGGAISFRSIHPRYSYVRLNEDGFVTEAAQQNPISHHATAGIFWFEKAEKLVDAIKNMIRKDASVGDQFYIAPVFNELILEQGRIGVRCIDLHQYHPLKTERHVYQFETAASI